MSIYSKYSGLGGNAGNSVIGPTISVVGDIPVFNNTTGSLLADSGIALSNVGGVGRFTNPLMINSSAPILAGDVMTIENDSTAGNTNLTLIRANATAGAASLRLLKCNGTSSAVKTPLLNGNSVGNILIGGWDGSVWKNSVNKTVTATENWDASHHGCTMLFSSCPTGQNNVTARLSFDGAGTVTAQAALIAAKALALLYQYVSAATSGGSSLVLSTVSSFVLNATATLTTYTVTLPTTPIDGQMLLITTNQEITSLTLTPSSGQTLVGTYTTLPLGYSIRLQYIALNTSWYPA